MPLSFHLPNIHSSVSWFVTRAALGVLLVTGLALSACTDTADQRAIQPGQVATGFGPTPFSQTTPVYGSANGSPGTSPVIGATPNASHVVQLPLSSRVYFTDGGDLWQIAAAGGEAAPVLTGRSILAFAPSPDGGQVAVIYTGGDSEQEHLADYNADGTPVIDIALNEPGSDKHHSGDIQSIAWSPTGDRVAVARQNGSIDTVTKDGTVTQIVAPDVNRFPGKLSISPDGQTLLYLDPALPGRNTSVFTISMNGGTPNKVVDGKEPSDPILDAVWLPDGSGIAYIQPLASSPNGSGDVFTVNAQTDASDLAVPSSQFAPVAGVGAMAFSRDGHWVAVTVFVPSNTGSRFGGLWLVNRETSATRKIPIDNDQTVTDLWWGNGTLLYRTVEAAVEKQPQHYGGLGSYSLYAVSPVDVQPTLRHTSK